MTITRPVVYLLVSLGLLLAGCAGAPTPTPTPTGGPVVTPEDAVARVIAHEPRLAGIGPRDPNVIGQSAWYEVAPASGVGAFIVTVRVGWGDCPSGCINEHTWLYAIGPDGSVTLQSEGGADVPPEAWPAPDGDGRTGVHLTAVAGPTCPVETVPPDPACAPKPVPNARIVIVDADGVQDRHVDLDAAGQLVVELEPGAYTMIAEDTAGFMSGPPAQQVTVEDGRLTEVVFTYDTGIR
jgi:hypothetical protein